MSRLLNLLPLYLCLSLLPSSGRAAEEAPPFDSLLVRAWAEAPKLEALRTGLRAADARVSSAGALDPLDLELRLRSEDSPSGRSAFPEVEARQGLSSFLRRGSRVELAYAERLAAEAGLDQERRQVMVELATLYAGLYAIEAERQSLSIARELLLALSRDAGTKYAAGQGDLAAAARAEVEITHLDERLLDLDADRARSSAAFVPFLTERHGAGDWTVSTLPAISVVADSVDAWSERRSSDVLVARAEVEAASRRVRVMELERSPELVLGAGVAKPPDRGADYQAMLGVSLPLFARRGAAVEASRHELDAAEASLREARARAARDAQAELARWRWAEAQLDLHSNRLLPQDETSFELARTSYMNGRGEFSAVIDAFRAWLDDQNHRASIEAERFVIWARIRALAEATEEK